MRTIDELGKEHAIRISPDDARTLARLLKQLLRQLGQDAGADRVHAAAPRRDAGDDDEGSTLTARARTVFFERKRRARHFNPVMFGEPAWDMLLALYLSKRAGARQSVGQLVSWVGAPHTTALRWINYLEAEGLLARRSENSDKRIQCIELTDRGAALLEDYLRDQAAA